MVSEVDCRQRVRATEPRRRMAGYVARSWPLYAMLVPGLVSVALFSYYPMYGVIIAFQDYNPGLGFAGSPWVGLQNFKFLFMLPGFREILWNSFFIAVSKIITVQTCAVVLALLLDEVRAIFAKRFIQTLIYLPHFLSWIVLGGILLDTLSPHGLVNRGLGLVGIQPILFLGSNTWF